ncbi:MAG: hydroxysqualene dehydroxylase HpnE [Ignavibacterium sp.]|uniref:hydroxysqualene dehydroxylase HpnE n=1 Tax=Ignavibacterium sp. TaxID=2651167 RepID=UPI00404A19DB
MKKVLVIGGGLAGLSAAAYLVKNKFDVTLIESSPKLGGRVYSFFDEKTNTEIDNGQHILMGCYSDTLSLLKMTNAYQHFHIAADGKNQNRLVINYLDRNQKELKLQSSDLPHPFNLLSALLSFNAFSVNDKLSMIKFFIKLKFIDSEKLWNVNVKQWLKNENQSDNVIKTFWEIISISALNTSTEKASAKIFCDILKEIFWKDKTSSLIILPSLSLSQSFIEPIYNYLIHNNCKVNLSEKCVSLEINNNRINKVITTSANSSKQNVYDKFDFVISAVPFFALKKLLDKNYLSIQSEFNYSSILNIHLWLTQDATKKLSFINEEFYAFNNSELHWLFNKQTHWNIVISNADKFMDMPKEKIFSFVLDELKNFIPIRKDDISEYKIIKEKRATFIPDKKTLKNRPAADTKIENLFLAGDWIDTKLPATIESAVKSGRWAAEKIIFNHN